MKTALLGIAFALLALTAFPIFECGLLFRQYRLDADKVTQELAEFDLPTKNALAQISASGKVIAQVGAQERNAFADQEKVALDSRAVLDKTGQVLDSLNGTILEVHNAVATQIVPDFEYTARDISRLLRSSRRDADSMAQSVDGSLAAVTKDAADFQPVIDNSAQVTQNLSAMTGDGRKLVNYEVNEIMKPVKKVETIFRFGIRTVGIFFGY